MLTIPEAVALAEEFFGKEVWEYGAYFDNPVKER